MTTPVESVTLREITAETVRAVTDLGVQAVQQNLVASNAVSLAQALFAPEAWFRAIYAGDALAGFVMLYDETLRPEIPENPQLWVWRLMIDARFQGCGIGRAAMRLVIDHARCRPNVKVLNLSYVPVPESAEKFYLGLGFRHTGRAEDGEIILELPLVDLP